MRGLVLFLLLILAALVQVSWAPFLAKLGLGVPVVLWGLFFLSSEMSPGRSLIYAFGAGLFLDLLGTTWLGSQALGLVLGVVSFAWVKSKWLEKPVLVWLAGTTLGTSIYLLWLWILANILPTT